jgi:heme oxygenase
MQMSNSRTPASRVAVRRRAVTAAMAAIDSSQGDGSHPHHTRLGTSAIRFRTHGAHRRLELEMDLMSSDLTMARYRSLLLGLASVHLALEREIGAQFRREPISGPIAKLAFQSRSRITSIANDLRVLGAALPAATSLRLSSVHGALGALYVCEGSRLGGDVIAGHVRVVLSETAPVEFFVARAGERATMWSTCCRTIDELLVTSASTDEAVTVAESVFGHFADVLR